MAASYLPLIDIASDGTKRVVEPSSSAAVVNSISTLASSGPSGGSVIFDTTTKGVTDEERATRSVSLGAASFPLVGVTADLAKLSLLPEPTFQSQASLGLLQPSTRLGKKSPRSFPNGDTYQGDWRDGRPNGWGLYSWADGSSYMGEWVSGQQHGRGCYVWPSGSKYEGDWINGRMQGVGLFTSPGGMWYQGSWFNGKKQGLGTKRYASGDVYEGLWSNDRHDGPGRYRWANGNEYNGEWRNGTMNGFGTFVWTNGDRYDGEWKEGQEDGNGRFTWADGSAYDGGWKSGQKHGKGTFYPAGALDWYHGRLTIKPRGRRTFPFEDGRKTLAASPAASAGDSLNISNRDSAGPSSASLAMIPAESDIDQAGGKGSGDEAYRTTDGEGLTTDFEGPTTDDGEDGPPTDGGLGGLRMFPLVRENTRASTYFSKTSREAAPEGPSDRRSRSGDGVPNRQPIQAEGSEPLEESWKELVVYKREYMHGALIIESREVIVKPVGRRTRRRPRRQTVLAEGDTGSRQGLLLGETVYKGHRSYDLMICLQVGIRYTVGKMANTPSRPLTKADFTFVDDGCWRGESGDGANSTSTEKFPREGSTRTPPHPSATFKWKDYCPMVFKLLKENSSIDTAEYMLSLCGGEALRELASPGKSGSVFYISEDNIYILKTMRKHEMHSLIEMLPMYFQHVTEYKESLLTRFYGLHRLKPSKGSRVRFVVMGNLLHTDLPLTRQYDLKGSTLGRETPAEFVNERTIFKDLDLEWVFQLEPGWRTKLMFQIERDCAFLEQQKIMDYSLLLGVHVANTKSLKALNHKRTLSGSDALSLIMSRCKTSPEELNNLKPTLSLTEHLAYTLGHQTVRLGSNMVATAYPKEYKGRLCDCPPDLTQKVVLYFGIIDILQAYNITKQVEHQYKSLRFNDNAISSVNPNNYARRFQSFMSDIFVE